MPKAAIRTDIRTLPKPAKNSDSTVIALAKRCAAAGDRREKCGYTIEIAECAARKIETPKAVLRTENDMRMHLFVGGGIGYAYGEAEIEMLRAYCRRTGRDTGVSEREGMACLRSLEILDAWTAWRAEVEAEEARTGLCEANKAFNDADDELDALAAQLAETPAVTIDGVLAKAAAMQYVFPPDLGLSNRLRDDLRRYGPDEGSLAFSLTRDLLGLIRSKEVGK
jgi:hypothetical protein